MNDDIPNLLTPTRFNQDKNFVRMHSIRRKEQMIIALIRVFFSCKTVESRQETMNELKRLDSELADMEILE